MELTERLYCRQIRRETEKETKVFLSIPCDKSLCPCAQHLMDVSNACWVMQDLGLTGRVIVVWEEIDGVHGKKVRWQWGQLGLCCLLWGMVALTRLLCCTHEDKQAAGGDGNVSLTMIEQGVMDGCLSLSFGVWDRTVDLHGEKLSIGCKVFFHTQKTWCLFIADVLFFWILSIHPSIHLLAICLSKDSGLCYVVYVQDKRCAEIAHSPSVDVFLPEDEDNPYESVATAVTRKPCSLDIHLHNASPRNG